MAFIGPFSPEVQSLIREEIKDKGISPNQFIHYLLADYFTSQTAEVEHLITSWKHAVDIGQWDAPMPRGQPVVYTTLGKKHTPKKDRTATVRILGSRDGKYVVINAKGITRWVSCDWVKSAL